LDVGFFGLLVGKNEELTTLSMACFSSWDGLELFTHVPDTLANADPKSSENSNKKPFQL
jgi:hypothetical protein